MMAGAVKIIALAVMFTCGAVARATELAAASQRQACVEQSASYLAMAEIDKPVETLVAKSREFYPDVQELIEDEIPSNEYSDAMQMLGNQFGCDTIVEHFRRLPQEVPCYATLNLEQDDMSTLDITIASNKAKGAFEAYFACMATARDD